MKIFLEGEQSQMHQAGTLKPGINEVPDDVGTALVEGCANYCDQVRKGNPRANPVQLFRLATEADEPKATKIEVELEFEKLSSKTRKSKGVAEPTQEE